jgi:branched-chain amino acid aminotransferase
MARFEGIKWASKQMRYSLQDEAFEIMEAGDKVYAVSRSIHYGLFLAFEGIRFFCKKNSREKFEIIFLNWDKNLKRLQAGISFNLSEEQQGLVPSVQKMEDTFIRFFQDPSIQEFLEEMAGLGAQGYFRPFTFDEDQSIGVTFPQNPAVRAVACRYDRYLGEPFSGVVVPNLVRAVGGNGTGCLKLGVNYLMSVKAVEAAKKVLPEAGAALFLDDRPHEPLNTRNVTEWDSSCCLFVLRDGRVIKIPESSLILPSVTIVGICAILRQMGVDIEERDMTYGELVERSKNDEMVACCSVGTAGIMNRAQKLILVNENNEIICTQIADDSHDLYRILGKARDYYWDIYQEKVPVPEGLNLQKYVL